jgi:hypothetical protein
MRSAVTLPSAAFSLTSESAARVAARTAPRPVVVRSSVGSWMTTISSSAVRWMSVSRKSAPSASALR